MKRTGTFTVEVDLPGKVTMPQMRQYIVDAVRGWKGQYDMGHPLFDLDRASVTVRSVSIQREEDNDSAT